MATVLDTLEESVSKEFEKLPDRYEIVSDEIVELPPMSFYATEVANQLKTALDRFLMASDIGRSRVELLFKIPLPEDRSRNRRPDLVFVSYKRWSRDRTIPFTGNALDVVPDIAVEVVSPGDSADDLIAKAREYLRGGVRLVWIVYPLPQEIRAYLPGAHDVRVFFAPDELEAGEILPGFRTSVGALFPPTEPPAATTQPETAT
jgi:Uma2 family endonuclease